MAVLPSGGPVATGSSPGGAPTSIEAAFVVSLGGSGPPFYDVALRTSDGGTTWTPVPVPHGAIAEGFGGFRSQGATIEAVFASGHLERQHAFVFPVLDQNKPVAEFSSDGGSTWHGTHLACQPGGPCVTLGPFLPDNCNMAEVTQPLLRSTNGGLSWSQPPLLDSVKACGQAQLFATSSRDALLVNSLSQFLLSASTDGGATWHAIALPQLPGQRLADGMVVSPDGVGDEVHGLTILPGGSLLDTQAGSGGWELLRAHATAWCRVRTPSKSLQNASQLTGLTVIGSDLWWLTGSSTGSPAVHAIPSASVGC